MEVSWRDYVDMRIAEREKAHTVQIESAQRNLSLAADALREKLDGMNQFRHQIDNERALYVKRDAMDALAKTHSIDIDRLAQRLEKLENWQANVVGRQLIFGAAIIVLAGIVTLVLRLVGH